MISPLDSLNMRVILGCVMFVRVCVCKAECTGMYTRMFGLCLFIDFSQYRRLSVCPLSFDIHIVSNR